MSKEDERRLDAFQNKCIRKILNINWKQKRSKDCIRSVTKQLCIPEDTTDNLIEWKKKRLPKLAMN